MIRLYPRLLRPNSRPSSIPFHSILLRSQYATKASHRPPPTQPTPRATQPRVARPSSEHLLPAQRRQQYTADQAYARGVRNVYTAPSHTNMLAFTWALGGSLVAWAVWLGIEGNWQMGDRMKGWQKIITESGFRLGMMFFAGLGWFFIIRYNGLVKSIELVHKAGNAKLRLSVRRMVPFLPPKQIIIPVQDLRLPAYWLHEADDLGLASGDLRRRGWSFDLRKVFWVPFSKFRDWLFRFGVVDAMYKDGSKRALLDLAGEFSNRGGDLWELTSTTGSTMRLR